MINGNTSITGIITGQWNYIPPAKVINKFRAQSQEKKDKAIEMYLDLIHNSDMEKIDIHKAIYNELKVSSQSVYCYLNQYGYTTDGDKK